MYSIYLFAVIGIVHGVIWAYRYNGSHGFERFFRLAMSTMCGAAAGFLLSGFLSPAVPTVNVVGEPVTLVSMRNQDGLTGSFIFGSGAINSSMSYNFLMKQKDGSMAPGSVYANEVVRLIEDPELKNVGFWQTTTRKPDPSHWLYNWTIFHSDKNRVVRQEFRVPVGSVIQQFNIR